MPQILVIDDDPAIQTLLTRTLNRDGYEVILAKDGEEGVVKARQFHPALVICDWLMPGLNGLEVCRQIKQTPELSTTYFILLTSLVSVTDRIQGLDTGADDFLCKPIEMNELAARVRAGLRIHQLGYDLQQQKQLLEAELAEAAEYVCSILPEPMRLSHINIDLRFIPSRQLGGDALDFYWLDDEHLVIYLLDVSGHGLRAALPALSVINLIRSQGLTQVSYYQPSQVLYGLNKTFQMTSRNDKYFTIWYGVFNRKTRQLVYSTAGHPPAILLEYNQEGKIREQLLKTPGFPVGMFPDAKYVDTFYQINSRATLYLFSDSLYEFEIAPDQILGLDKLSSLLQDCCQNFPVNLEGLLNKLKSLNINNNFPDDLSIIKIDFS
jgi:sigma-B regulation protein RsbU (phosphoserine phosphatase)